MYKQKALSYFTAIYTLTLNQSGHYISHAKRQKPLLHTQKLIEDSGYAEFQQGEWGKEVLLL